MRWWSAQDWDGARAPWRWWPRLWKRLSQPAVFDADALFALPLAEAAGGQRVLTPHEGELEQLLGADALKPGRVAAVIALAKAAHCIALLKGPGTLVAQPDGALSQNSTGNPGASHRRRLGTSCLERSPL